jgi:tetratricopeptide (TPR) repeat protein
MGTLCFLAAVLSKTVTGSLPAALLLVLWWKEGYIPRRAVVCTLPLFAVAVVMGAVTGHMERWSVGAVGPEWDISLANRILIAGKAVWFYAGKIVAPNNLSFIYERWILTAVDLIYPLGAALLVAGLWMARKRMGRGPLAASLFFVGTLFPALGFVNIYPMRFAFVADHFQYLASIGLIVLLAELLRRAWPMGFLVTVVLAILSWHRSIVFQDEQRLWEDTLAKNPGAWVAHVNLGSIAIRAGDFPLAAGHFDQSIKIDPNRIDGYLAMAELMMRLHQPNPAVDFARKAVTIHSRSIRARMTLAAALEMSGDPAGALEQCLLVLDIEPGFIPAHRRMVDLYTALGRPDRAAEHQRTAERLFREALGRSP